MMQVSGVLVDVSAVVPSCCREVHKQQCTYFFDYKSLYSSSTRNCLFNRKLQVQREKSRSRSFKVRASENSGNETNKLAPLQLESPAGQLLTQILQTHPHLHQATADQQLEELQSQRDAQKNDATTAASSQDLLYKRIAEVKENDRRKTLEEILYCLVVQKFVDNGIKMIRNISSTSDPTGRVDSWPNQEHELESIHSVEAFEMILSHLALILGERVVGPPDSIIQMSKIKLGKLYAASIMYGYFLRRVDERYQLERSMNTLPDGFGEDLARLEDPKPEKQMWDADSLIRIYPDGEGGGIVEDSSNDEKGSKLRSYVMYLDAETLQRYATIRSKEAVSLIEKQTQSLFGRPEIRVTKDGSLDASNDEAVSLSFNGLTMLVLEAVAFGSFLWDMENYAESKYNFLKS